MDAPILYFMRYVPAYRVPVFEALNERLAGRFIVCAGRAGSSLRSIEAGKTSFRMIQTSDLWVQEGWFHAQAFWQGFRKVGRPAAVLAEESPRTGTLPLLGAYCKVRGIPFGLWGHFSSNDRPMGSSGLDRYRLNLASRADVCITYTHRQAHTLKSHLPHDRVVAATNTLDTDMLEAARKRLDLEGKDAVRVRLGLQRDALTIVYIGRLIAEKGVDVLLDVLQIVQKRRPAQLIIVGDGERRLALENRVREESISDVHLIGTITDLEAGAPYIFASDAMLVPGYLGLQVNHAFSLGVPIVGRTSPGPGRYHSPEVDFIENGLNSILTETSSPQTFADAVLKVAEDPSYGRNALDYAQKHLGIDRMVDGLEEGIRLLLERGSVRANRS